MKTNDDFWNCKCKTDYIHNRQDLARCDICKTDADTQPDSRQDEVEATLMFCCSCCEMEIPDYDTRESQDDNIYCSVCFKEHCDSEGREINYDPYEERGVSRWDFY